MVPIFAKQLTDNNDEAFVNIRMGVLISFLIIKRKPYMTERNHQTRKEEIIFIQRQSRQSRSHRRCI
jgi:hypothetical protein